jgi:crossover junction endodeoxyribonuclease RuvC
MSRFFAGIDPGGTGGWAILDEGSNVIVSPYTTFPDFAVRVSDYKDISVGLEAVHAMPGQGVSSTFKFGANFGGWEATLQLLKLSYILIPPQRWQKDILGIIPKGESKPRALAYAQRRWPNLDLRKKDSGIVDALCIALYTRKQSTGLL